jgi:hypothetical protein
MMNPPKTIQPGMLQKNTLHLNIDALEANGAHRYDPVRFIFIQSMARRTLGKSGSLYKSLERKAMSALAEYQKNFDSARLEAEEIVNRVCSVFPEAEIKIRELFENNEFKKVHRLGEKLDRRHRQTDLSVLKDHVVRFSPDCGDNNNQPSPSSIDDLLRQQERDVLADVVASVANTPEGGAPALNDGKTATVKFETRKKESRSLQHFKDTMVRLHSDRLVTRAIQDLPENSGPHNSQMLATNALKALRQISPNYLNRFVSHIGSLIYLKQAGEEADKLKAKKTKKSRTA